jgi:ATP-dependent Clp protease ATP-binding subunit ClpA
MTYDGKLIRWQKEFDLYRDYKSLFILEGNINDYQVSWEDEDLSFLSLDNFLYNHLHEAGYASVVFFNHVDGFYVPFKNGDEDLKIFHKIQNKNYDFEEMHTTQKINDEEYKFSKFSEATTSIRKCIRNDQYAIAIILKLASRYITTPERIQENEQYLFSELLLASQEKQSGNKLRNLIIMVADKSNDIPAWIYLGNTQSKTLFIPQPDKHIRRAYIESNIDNFYTTSHQIAMDKRLKQCDMFVDYTEGFTLFDLDHLYKMMFEQKIELNDIDKAVTLFKYGIPDNPWADPKLLKRLPTLETDIKKRIKGQSNCIRQAVDVITRSIIGLSGIQHSLSKTKPKGIMFLAGPTGTGKTELAKSIAQWLFGTEEACIRFDMSEYQQSHSDQRLLGAPPGYVGYEAGGQLTNSMKERPFSVLLFDEIEKAHNSILDKFLQILEDGRMTDGKGETVHFSDSLIIFTSNLGILSPDPYNPNASIVKVPMPKTEEEKKAYRYSEYRNQIMDEIKNFFTNRLGRPEILNRLGENFLIFEYIDENTAKLIAKAQLDKIQLHISKQSGTSLEISDQAFEPAFPPTPNDITTF